MLDWLTLGASPWSRADWLSLGQLVFTVLGFGVAAWQLSRTADAAQETNKKLGVLQTRFASNDLLVALPSLQGIEDVLDSALKSGNQTEVERALTNYARTATEIVTVIGGRPDMAEEKLTRGLPPVARAAMKVRSELSKGASPDLTGDVAPVLQKMFAVSPEISAAVARLQRSAEDA